MQNIVNVAENICSLTIKLPKKFECNLSYFISYYTAQWVQIFFKIPCFESYRMDSQQCCSSVHNSVRQYMKEIHQQSFRCKKIIYFSKNALFKSFFEAFVLYIHELQVLLWQVLLDQKCLGIACLVTLSILHQGMNLLESLTKFTFQQSAMMS